MTDRRLLISSILGAIAMVGLYYGAMVMVVIPSQRHADPTQTPRRLITLPAPQPTPFLPGMTPYPSDPAPAAPYTPVLPTFMVVTATPALMIPASITPPCPCDRNRYNCGHWDNKADMLACYDYCMGLGLGDVHDLDGDNDGIPCEHLR